MSKETWVEEILQSAEQIQRVPANYYLTTRIESRLKQSVFRLPVKWVYAYAAGMILLLIVNISVIKRTAKSIPKSDDVQILMQEYGWSSDGSYSLTNSNR